MAQVVTITTKGVAHDVITLSHDTHMITLAVYLSPAMQALLVLVACLGVAQGLYFHIAETEQKCFIEEVPAETMIVGKRSN